MRRPQERLIREAVETITAARFTRRDVMGAIVDLDPQWLPSMSTIRKVLNGLCDNHEIEQMPSDNPRAAVVYCKQAAPRAAEEE